MENTSGLELLNGMVKADILGLMPKSGRLETSVPGLAISRYDRETSPAHCLYSPMIAYVVQGSKQAFYGDWETTYGTGQCVVLGIDVPGVYQIKNASQATPFLSLAIKVDNGIISRLFGEMPRLTEGVPVAAAPAGVMKADFDLLDAFRRLVRLLQSPENIPVLAPLILREIHFYVLSGPLGSQLRLFNISGTKGSQIRRAISWLRDNYKCDLKIPQLAEQSHMASSTFNRYFRQVTGLSPLQFQKHLRLHEAERLMLVENYDASAAASAVGYGSGSQFTKEYKRLFGAPPRRNIAARQAS